MAVRSRPRLGSHLEWHGNKIRVRVRVPESLRKHFGTMFLRETLQTSSPRDAEILKGAVITRLKLRIREAHNGKPNDDPPDRSIRLA